MPETYLLFQLYGPMAAWGDVAVGEVRPTSDHPSKSAVFGLLAAALGIRRFEEEKHEALFRSYGFAVCLDAPGVLLRDYHTAQVSSGKQGRDLPTRSDELAYSKIETILSTRDYRCDALATICLWMLNDTPAWSFEALGAALRAPAFTLYLGRKACPLSLPMNPQIVTAANIRSAFDIAHSKGSFVKPLIRTESAGTYTARVYWEGEDNQGFKDDQILERRDELRSRIRWQFAQRQERFSTMNKTISNNVPD